MKNFLIGKVQISETAMVGFVLSLVGGFTDAYTFLIRGKVLANAQTGNIVFLGLNLIEGSFKNAFFYFLPVLAFALGVFIAEFTRDVFKSNKIHWLQVIILFEIIILIICSFMPRGNLDVYVNILISFFCSLQVQSFRKTKGNLSATTMCTGNLRSGSEQFYTFLTTGSKAAKENSIIYFGLIFFFTLGAILGSFFSLIFVEKALLVCTLILIGVFIILFKEEIEEI